MFYLSLGIFLAVFAAIASEKVDKTLAALAGASLVLLGKLLSQPEALHDTLLGVDWNVILLLVSMMIIVNILAKTGVFQYLAVQSAKLAKGEPFTLLVIFILFTAAFSSLLDNVTTVLLVAPVTLMIAAQLEIDPVPFLISEALASNIGGTATLIGDPPNIMIGSKTGLDFMDFLTQLGPIVLLILLAWLVVWKFVFAKRLKVRPELKRKVMNLNARELISDWPLLKKSCFVLGLTILGFMLHGLLGLEPASLALAGATALMLLSRSDPAEVFAQIEWPSIFFFIGLFIVVGATIKSGVIEALSRQMITLTSPDEHGALGLSLLTLWFSGLASGVVDNIPFVATLNPLLAATAEKILGPGQANLRGPVMLPVWWALSLGACLGGNATAIGATANVIVLAMAEKAGYPISFGRFFKYGAPVTLLSIILSTFYLYARYFLFT